MTGSCPLRPTAKSSILAAAVAAVVFGLPQGLTAQSKLEREVTFVRGLARDMRFISLAQLELDRLRRDFRGGTDQDRIDQLGVEISLVGAKSKPDRDVQRQLFKEALDRSLELINRTSDGAVASEARATLADAAQEFGEFLINELEIARNENPDAVKGLEEEASTVFKAGVEACEKVMLELQTKPEHRQEGTAIRLQYGLMWLRKGVLQREHGRAVRADAGFLIPRSRSTLEDLCFEFGEHTALGLRALFEMAQGDEVLGKFDDAIDFYNGTIEQIATSLRTADELGLNADTQGFLFNMQQEVYDRLCRVLFEQGRAADAEKTFAGFRASLKEFGAKDVDVLDVADPRYGHSVFLTEARFLAESGDPQKADQALKTAQVINDRHPADIVGVRAKAVMRDILAQQKNVSGALLLEVAKGESQSRNHEAAIIGIRKALAAMNQQEQQKHGLEAYELLGRSFGVTERWIESVLAFREGLQRFGRLAENRTAAEGVCDYLDRAMQQLRRNTKNDPAFDALKNEVDALLTEMGGSATGDKLHWKEGITAMAEKRYKDAATRFGQISRDFLYHELARVRVGTALQMAGDLAGAQKAIDDYRTWSQSPEAAIEARRTDLAQVRSQATGEAWYRDAAIAVAIAQGTEGASTPKDLTKYPGAIDKLRVFLSNHAKDADSLVPFALYSVGALHTELGEMQKAEEAYVTLREKDPTQGSRLCSVIFDAYLTQVTNLEKERDKAIGESKPDASINAIRAELKSTRQRLVALGDSYIKNSPEPQYAIFSHTVRQLDELKEWAKVEEVALKALARFEKDKTYQDNLDRFLRPKVGEALLRQRKFQQAYDMLIEAEKVNPTLWELKRLIALTLGGWLEFDERGRMVVVPGLDKPAEGYKKYWEEYQQWALRPEVAKYSLDWYRFHWEAYWFARRAAEIGTDKSDFKARAASLYGIARSIDNFETLKKLGESGLELFNYFNLNRPL